MHDDRGIGLRLGLRDQVVLDAIAEDAGVAVKRRHADIGRRGLKSGDARLRAPHRRRYGGLRCFPSRRRSASAPRSLRRLSAASTISGKSGLRVLRSATTSSKITVGHFISFRYIENSISDSISQT